MQEEAEEQYKQMFPDFGETFSEFASPPDDTLEPGSPSAMGANPGSLAPNSAAAQSLLRGQMLESIVSLHQWYSSHTASKDSLRIKRVAFVMLSIICSFSSSRAMEYLVFGQMFMNARLPKFIAVCVPLNDVAVCLQISS